MPRKPSCRRAAPWKNTPGRIPPDAATRPGKRGVDTSGIYKKIRGHGIGRGASAGAGRVRHYISKRDLGRADAAGCAGCVYCVCPRQRFFGPSGIFGPAGAAGGGGRAARRTGGADGGAFVRYLGRAGLVPFGRGPFQRRSLLLRACPRVPEPSTLPFWQNTIFCGTRHT